MKGLGLIAVIVAVWLILRNRSHAATNGGAGSPDELSQLLPSPPVQQDAPAVNPFAEGLPYNNADASSYASVDGSVTGTDFNAIEAYDNYLLYGIEAPLAPARPNGG